MAPAAETLMVRQDPWPQVVLFGDSLFQFSTALQDGFSFHGALQARMWA